MNGCTPVPAVTFDYAQWLVVYPYFSGISQGAAQAYFNLATLYCANKLGPVCDVATLAALLYLLTAHVAWLMSPKDANGNPTSSGGTLNPVVGRMSSATEGSVSIQTDNQYAPGSAQWFQQTPWGAAYWQATAIYRTFRWRASPRGALGLAQIPWIYVDSPSGR